MHSAITMRITASGIGGLAVGEDIAVGLPMHGDDLESPVSKLVCAANKRTSD